MADVTPVPEDSTPSRRISFVATLPPRSSSTSARLAPASCTATWLPTATRSSTQSYSSATRASSSTRSSPATASTRLFDTAGRPSPCTFTCRTSIRCSRRRWAPEPRSASHWMTSSGVTATAGSATRSATNGRLRAGSRTSRPTRSTSAPKPPSSPTHKPEHQRGAGSRPSPRPVRRSICETGDRERGQT